jgi:hypothetical protein
VSPAANGKPARNSPAGSILPPGRCRCVSTKTP